jgi:hypothetical protein
MCAVTQTVMCGRRQSGVRRLLQAKSHSSCTPTRAPYVCQRTDRAARMGDRCISTENTMRVEHKLLVLGVTLAGAITGAMSVQFGGFIDSYIQTGQATAIARTVADVTSVGDADERQEAGTRYELTATNPAGQQ